MPSDILHYPFQIVGTDLFYWNGQTFVWWRIITVDIGKLRNYTRQMQQQQ